MENKNGKIALNDNLLDKVSGGWAPAPVLCVDPEACPFNQICLDGQLCPYESDHLNPHTV